jgi:hypothetical protein
MVIVLIFQYPAINDHDYQRQNYLYSMISMLLDARINNMFICTQLNRKYLMKSSLILRVWITNDAWLWISWYLIHLQKFWCKGFLILWSTVITWHFFVAIVESKKISKCKNIAVAIINVKITVIVKATERGLKKSVSLAINVLIVNTKLIYFNNLY